VGDFTATITATNGFGSTQSTLTIDTQIVLAWGDDSAGEIDVPANLSNVVALAGGGNFSLALLSNGTVTGWGDNTFGETSIPGINNVVAIAAGSNFGLALMADGTVTGWGGPSGGGGREQLPAGARANSPATTIPPGLSNVVAIAAGTDFSLALQVNGTVVGWGNDSFGATDIPPGLSNVTAIAAGNEFGLALVSGGTVVGWGDNLAGETNIPAGLTNVVAIAAGSLHALALKSDGTVVGWGDNELGETTIPAGLTNVVAIAAGSGFSLALRSDGTVVGWGDNSFGETTIPSGLNNVAAISAGSDFSLALLTGQPATTKPVILNTPFALAAPGAVFTYPIRALNKPTSYSATGLPAGLSINASTGVISGNTTAATGTYQVTLSATNSAGTGKLTLALTLLPSTEATLSKLVLSSGTLNPVFSTATTTYSATVSNATSALTVTPTVTQPQEVVTVDGTVVPSGVASGAISLVPGVNTITILITAQDGVTTNTYTLFVTRAELPTVTTGEVTGVLSNAATFNGTVNADGANTTASFQYGLTTNYGSTVTAVPATVTGSSDTAVSATVANLLPSTTYHYRVQGINASGTAQGLDATFTTSAFAATLSGLKVSSGTLSPAFAGATTSYAVSVAAAVSSITLTPTASAGNNATISVNGVTVASGSASLPVSLSPGANVIPVVVTASGAVTTYTITVTQQTAPVVTTLAQTAVTATGATLNGTINASGASTTVSFDYGLTTNYGSTKAATPASVTGTTPTAVKAALTGLTVGATYYYRIRGVSANGTSLGGKMMFTTPSNVATLAGLTLSSGTLSPVFSGATITYTAAVSNATDSLMLTPTVSNGNATVTVNGTAVISGSASGPIALNAGPNVIKVVVTAQDGLTIKTYTVTVTRIAVLATVTTTSATGISATGATFTGSVNPNNGTTTASFDYGTSTSYGSNIAASQSPVSGNAATLVSASVATLKPGTLYHYRTKGVNVAGTATGGDMTFTTLSNVATLSGLVLNGGTLSPVFSVATTSYTATVPVTTTSVTVKPTVTQAQATVTVNGNITTSGTASGALPLSLGPNVITVAVTAQDGVTVKTYTVVVTQAALPSATTLAATSVEATTATVNGTANAEGASTAVTFNYGTSISYGSTATASPASVTGGSATVVSATLSALKPATLYHYRIKAVNVDGTATGSDMTFTTLNNVATLSGLSLSSGTLSPAFASATVGYTATVSSSVTSVTVKPTVTTGSSATVQVNGNTVASGTSSGAISISAGANVITVVVTAQDGTIKTYTVTVVQPEVPSVVTGSAFTPTATTATLNGTVNANGTNTTASFSYGKTSSYGSTMAATPATVTGEAVTSVSAKLTGLAPSTTYYYQIKGVSTAGASTGGGATFTTPSNVATLSGLVVSGATLSPVFSGTTTSYKATVSNATASVTLTPTVTNANATVTVNGATVTSGMASATLNLNAGVNTFVVVVTAQDGTTIKTYTVAVTRTALLATMNTLSAGGVGTTMATLNGTAVANNATTNLSFDYGTSTSYGHNVIASPSTTAGTTNTTLSANLTGLIAGTTYHYRAKGVNTAGTATGSDMIFTTFSNVATLSGLKLSTGTLSPAFNSNTTAYTVTLPNATASMTVTPAVTNNSHATVTVNGTAVVSGTPSGVLTLAPGLNVLVIAVTAQDGSTVVSYTVNVTRTTPPPVVVTLGVTGLGTGGATLTGTVNASGTSTTPAFDYGLTTAYSNSIAATPSSVTGSTATAVSAAVSGLSPGTTYHYRVNAVNAGGLSSGLDATFTTISNVATLSNLVLSTGAMDQSFAPATMSYTQTVSFNTTSLTATPTVTAGSHATVKVDGTAVVSGAASGALALTPGSNTITVLVTAQDGVTQDTYTITVTVPIESDQPKGQNMAALPVTVSALVPIKAQLTGPVANGGVLPDAATAFVWNAGRGVSEYWLSVGSTVGGKDFYDGSQGQSLGRTVTLPTDGDDVYVTLQSMINGTWRANNYVYTTANTTAKAVLTGPVANGGVLSNGAATFTWNAGSGVSEYWLSVGSAAGGTDLYDGDQGLALSHTVTLPTSGEAVYVTLRSMINGLWLSNSYTFSAADTTKAVLTAPANQSVLPGAMTVFTWDAVPGAAAYWLSIGSTAGGTDLYDASQGTALTQTVTLPTDGRELFVALKTSVNGQWLASNSTLTACGGAATVATQSRAPVAPAITNGSSVPLPGSPTSGSSAPPAAAELTSPADGVVLSGSPVTFTWKTATGASEYWLSVGSSTIATDLYSASQGSNLKVTIAVPTDGSPLYVTISSLIDGQWLSNQYLYQAALPP
jgi:phosphodiesterase/alkaline phosphatase D-like protein